jgi:hypothetical protein
LVLIWPSRRVARTLNVCRPSPGAGSQRPMGVAGRGAAGHRFAPSSNGYAQLSGGFKGMDVRDHGFRGVRLVGRADVEVLVA